MNATEKDPLSLRTEELRSYREWDNQNSISALGRQPGAAEVSWGREATPFWFSPVKNSIITKSHSCTQQKQSWPLWMDKKSL